MQVASKGKDGQKLENVLKNVPLVATAYPASRNGQKGVMLDIELDHRANGQERFGPQSNPHLTTKTTEVDGGPKKYDHRHFYTNEQYDNEIKGKGATMQHTGPSGAVREVTVFNADIMSAFKGATEGKGAETKEVPRTRTKTYDGVSTTSTDFKGKRVTERMTDRGSEKITSSGFAVNTKTITAPEFDVYPGLVDDQFKATREAQNAAKAAREAKAAEKAAPQAPAAPEAPEAPQNDNPAPEMDDLASKLGNLQSEMEKNQGQSKEGPELG